MIPLNKYHCVPTQANFIACDIFALHFPTISVTLEMSFSKFDQTDELAVLQNHKDDLQKDFEDKATTLLILLNELESHQLVSKEVAELFCSIDDQVETKTKVRYLLQQVYNKVAKNPALFGSFLLVLNKVEKKKRVKTAYSQY